MTEIRIVIVTVSVIVTEIMTMTEKKKPHAQSKDTDQIQAYKPCRALEKDD